MPLRDAVRNCRSLCRIDHGGIPTAVCFDPQNAMLYVADLRGVVACYDTTQFLVEMDLVPCSANGPIGNDAATREIRPHCGIPACGWQSSTVAVSSHAGAP